MHCPPLHRARSPASASGSWHRLAGELGDLRRQPSAADAGATRVRAAGLQARCAASASSWRMRTAILDQSRARSARSPPRSAGLTRSTSPAASASPARRTALRWPRAAAGLASRSTRERTTPRPAAPCAHGCATGRGAGRCPSHARAGAKGCAMTLRFDAAVFDMDGVLTRSSRLHAAAWKALFDDLLRKREGEAFRPFDAQADYRAYVDGKPCRKGVRSFLRARHRAGRRDPREARAHRSPDRSRPRAARRRAARRGHVAARARGWHVGDTVGNAGPVGQRRAGQRGHQRRAARPRRCRVRAPGPHIGASHAGSHAAGCARHRAMHQTKKGNE